MKAMLSDHLWSDVAEYASSHRRLRAAIAYVTTDHLKFRSGDVLVCDASDTSVKAGMTTAAQLRKFVDAGAEIYSYSGLHSKVVVLDDHALIGSANLSDGAAIRTCEACLLTDDPQIVALTLAFVEKVRLEGVRVTPAFLRRIELLPVRSSRLPRRGSSKSISVGQSRVWFISTHRLSERLIEAEARFDELGLEEAKRLVVDGAGIESVRWAGKSRFRAVAKAGDVVIQAFSWRTGSRQFTEVYDPVPIIYRYDQDNWTRFYLDYAADANVHRWREVEKTLKPLGIRNIARSSTRELTGSQLAILSVLDNKSRVRR